MSQPELKLDINADALGAAVATAIFQQMTEESKQQTIQAAIQYLLTQPKSEYSYGPRPNAPLQNAFNTAVDRVARDMATEFVESDVVFRQAIQNALREMATKVLTESRFIQEQLASALVAVLAKEYD